MGECILWYSGLRVRLVVVGLRRLPIGWPAGVMDRVPSGYVGVGSRLFALVNVGTKPAYFAVDSVTSIEPHDGTRSRLWCSGSCFEFKGTPMEVVQALARAETQFASAGADDA